MIKKIGIVSILVLLMLIVAVSFCGCSKGSGGGGGGKTDEDATWHNEDLTPYQVYSNFLGGFIGIGNEFTKSKLKGNNKISADAKMKVEVNTHEFWATMKLNYDNATQENAMFAFEFTGKEDSYEDLLLGIFLYQQKAYLAFGETKFSLDFPVSQWSSVFPFEDSNVTVDKAAVAMAAIMVNKEDYEVKKRQNGMNEEYKIALNIDVAASIQRLITQYIDTEKSDPDTIKAFEEILYSVFGLTIADVKGGKFPKSTLKVNFVTSNLKLSELKVRLEIEGTGKSTILSGEDIEVEVDLDKFEIAKTNTSIPFVNNDYAAERAKYIYFLDKSFRYVSANTTRINDANKEYDLSITAKIFQGVGNENYAFMEYRDKTTHELEVAGYVYQDVAYLFEKKAGTLVCTTKLPLDISTVANKVANNDFEPKTEPKILSIIGYILGAIRIGNKGISFVVDEDLFNIAWYNFNDALAYLNAALEEDAFANEGVNSFKNFVTEKDWVIDLKYDVQFLTLVEDTDPQLLEAIARANAAVPETELHLKGSGE